MHWVDQKLGACWSPLLNLPPGDAWSLFVHAPCWHRAIVLLHGHCPCLLKSGLKSAGFFLSPSFNKVLSWVLPSQKAPPGQSASVWFFVKASGFLTWMKWRRAGTKPIPIPLTIALASCEVLSDKMNNCHPSMSLNMLMVRRDHQRNKRPRNQWLKAVIKFHQQKMEQQFYLSWFFCASP